MVGVNLLASVLKRVSFLGKKVAIPVDIIVMRMIEIMLSIPTLFLIIGLMAMLDTQSLALIIGNHWFYRLDRYCKIDSWRTA